MVTRGNTADLVAKRKASSSSSQDEREREIRGTERGRTKTNGIFKRAIGETRDDIAKNDDDTGVGRRGEDASEIRSSEDEREGVGVGNVTEHTEMEEKNGTWTSA